MSNDPVLKREPLLDFIADRQFISSAAITQELSRMGFIGRLSEPDSRQLLGRYLARALPSLPEGVYLTSLLTSTAFVSAENYLGRNHTPGSTLDPSESYLPAPGISDAIQLSPRFDTDEYDNLPPFARRTAAWLVVAPAPALVVLTYDPAALGDLEMARTYWFDEALHRRRDVAGQITDRSRHFTGLCSPHQILQPGDRWRQMPVSDTMRSVAEEYHLDPYLETELALYCWSDAAEQHSTRELQNISDIVNRRVIVRPRLYPTHLSLIIDPPAPPPLRLLNPSHDRWRQLFIQLVEDCAEEGDSDIHLLPKDSGGYTIQRRRSGHLKFVGSVPAEHGAAYISAALAGSEIEHTSQRAVPKDGRMTLHLHRLRRTIDLRIAVAPGGPPYTSPAVVFRLLDPSTVRGGLEQLLFAERDRLAWQFAESIKRGLILVTGPTGSGKSRTLYAFLQSLHNHHPDESFKSIEDPIELRLGEWFQQNQVNHAAGVGFATILRAMLRADPETILVGEIRDQETAQQAVTAARSGHRIISTLHVNSPADVPRRLQELGVAPTEIKSLLRFVSSQELLGRSCPNPACRSFVPIPDEARSILGDRFDPTQQVLSNVGCPHCFNLGVRGRFASQEYLLIPEDDHELVDAIGNGDPTLIRRMQSARQQPSLAERSMEFAIGEHALTNIQEVLSNQKKKQGAKIPVRPTAAEVPSPSAAAA